MGKRSNFDRKDKDFYETPRSAVVPLIPHLPKKCNYVEPCAGDGALLKHLSVLHGALCWGMYDKYPKLYTSGLSQADATTHTYIEPINCFITNPPWSTSILHPIIDNLAGQKPTWLLFYADWMHTKQSAEYMKYCVKVVSIGRVKWFPDSKHTGKDNCCWYLFDKNHTGATEFVGR